MSSAQQLLLTALRCEIESLRHLATTAEIVGDISRFIHVLQRERGASTIYLASRGERFKTQRLSFMDHSREAEALMRQRLEALGEDALPQAAAVLLRRIANVWLALDELADLRHAIDTFTISADAATQAFNRLISGLLGVVFEAADTCADPEITRILVASFHLMQGKELAGQERACGGFGFTLGYFDEARKQLLQQLEADQQRCFATFTEFATPEAQQAWQQAISTRTLSGIVQLRETASQLHDVQAAINHSLSDTWYELATLRIDSMQEVENTLSIQLIAACYRKIAAAQAELERRQLAADDQPAPGESLLALGNAQPLGDLTASAFSSPLSRSLIDLTHAQSSRLQGLSDELENTRKALRERKLIERAKGLIMAHQSMSEEEAYRFLRKTSMDQSKSMAAMAQSILDLATMLKRKADTADS